MLTVMTRYTPDASGTKPARSSKKAQRWLSFMPKSSTRTSSGGARTKIVRGTPNISTNSDMRNAEYTPALRHCGPPQGQTNPRTNARNTPLTMSASLQFPYQSSNAMPCSMGGIVTCTRNSQIQKPIAGNTSSQRAQSHSAPAPLRDPCMMSFRCPPPPARQGPRGRSSKRVRLTFQPLEPLRSLPLILHEGAK